MQTIEALISLVVFLSMAILMLNSMQQPYQPDDSLYRMQLGGDIWRVLYLKGSFEDFDGLGRPALESDAIQIQDMTGFCIYIGGIRNTNCRGARGDETIVSMQKIVIQNGHPKQVTFSVHK
jgi:hypothetical protein